MLLIPIKQVPDSWSEKELDSSTKRLAREKADPVLNDLDEFALEAALQVSETLGLKTAVITVGPSGAREALVKALSMGVDEAFHVCDGKLAGACYMQTSAAIAAAAKKVGATAIFTGLESTDGKGAVVPSLVAAHLKWPNISAVAELVAESGSISAKLLEPNREVEYTVPFPCVLSLAENAYQPRFPSFKGIMAAKKKEITEMSVDDLLDQGFDKFLTEPSIEVVDWEQSPPRSKGALITEAEPGIATLVTVLGELREAK